MTSKKKEPPAESVELEHQAPEGVDPVAIAAEWADEYAEGSELFCGTFDAEDFDAEYGETAFPDNTTIAVRRCTRYPTPGWVRRHTHLGSRQIEFRLLEKHASPKALAILDNLKTGPWEEFVAAWGDDGVILPKSSRSSRQSESTKTPSEKTS